MIAFLISQTAAEANLNGMLFPKHILNGWFLSFFFSCALWHVHLFPDQGLNLHWKHEVSEPLNGQRSLVFMFNITLAF